MNYLYLVLNLGSLLIPFIFSFHPKLKFYKYWKALFLSLIITMMVFIPWDIIFTLNGIWGFNDSYFIGNKLLHLPIEEWLFFICIPYACVFTHYALVNLIPNLGFGIKPSNIITFLLIFGFVAIALLHHDKWYTLVNFSYASLLLIMVKRYCPEVLKPYYLTFLVMLIPFFIVNGVLTGSLIENEVVWYNHSENLNIRLLTIPIEDAVYAFTLILTNLALTHIFYKRIH